MWGARPRGGSRRLHCRVIQQDGELCYPQLGEQANKRLKGFEDTRTTSLPLQLIELVLRHYLQDVATVLELPGEGN